MHRLGHMYFYFQELIRGDPKSEEARISAAIEIQRRFRGYCTRCRILNTLLPKASQEAMLGQNNPSRMDEVQTPTEVHNRLTYSAEL